MPGPDPEGLSYDETPDGRPIVLAQVWGDRHPSPFSGCPRTRLARAHAVLMNLQRDGWTCPACGDPVPLWRRADAVYCSTGCRKREARKRRKLLTTDLPTETARTLAVAGGAGKLWTG